MACIQRKRRAQETEAYRAALTTAFLSSIYRHDEASSRVGNHARILSDCIQGVQSLKSALLAKRKTTCLAYG